MDVLLLLQSIPFSPSSPLLRLSSIKFAAFPVSLKSTERPFPRLAVATRVSSSSAQSLPSISPSTAEAASHSLLSPISSSIRWVVAMEKPPGVGPSRKEVVDYYVETLAKVLGSEKEAQMCIYDASWENHYRFCCDIDEGVSRELARLPGVLSVRPDGDEESGKKDYSNLNLSLAEQLKSDSNTSSSSPTGSKNEYWLVQMEKPGVEVVTKAQMVDNYTQILTKVLGNEKDAQVCIYHISWEKDFGFCCQIDEECANELADVAGVLSVRPDKNFGSDNKNYRGDDDLMKSAELNQLSDVKTKRLFVTGLSFYTSEKTLRAAFEGFGELVEVKIIMDKISKRSKGYAFIEYTTEEAASAALKEMNGKIINGWMIVVDVARTNPPRNSRGRPRPLSPLSSSY
ncbi:organelle RRM domain-containing protein 1, chloroplastic [Typha latifolia]|uniref:organelle RRM domain-containing protein 1, chloroplastic n=1 Tax=Typha latifolia TaxID=4733 RepID=UPI003C2E828E